MIDPFAGIPVVESRYLDPKKWGHYLCGTIFTHDAKRLAANLEHLGINRKTGEIVLLPGTMEIPA